MWKTKFKEYCLSIGLTIRSCWKAAISNVEFYQTDRSCSYIVLALVCCATLPSQSKIKFCKVMSLLTVLQASSRYALRFVSNQAPVTHRVLQQTRSARSEAQLNVEEDLTVPLQRTSSNESSRKVWSILGFVNNGKNDSRVGK